MDNFVVKGNIFYSESSDSIKVVPNAYLVCENGLSAGVFQTLPERYACLPVTDFGDRLIIPGMTDLHVHGAQFAYRGLGMDMELLDWLNTYAFPEEAKFADLSYADRAYTIFADHLRRSTTTRAAVFASLHAPATTLLMDKMEASGLVSCVGKVNMDRRSPSYLQEKSPEEALAVTEDWLCQTRDRYENTKPIITPRFIPTCTDALLTGLGRLVEKYQVPVQSHLSENLREIALVQELCPESKFYGDAYDRFGLFGGKYGCIMAHCVHSGMEEIALMKKNGVYIAHSPLSNANIASGVAPMSRFLEAGLNVGLASDIAGGESENLFRTIAVAIQSSKLRWRLLDQDVTPLTVDQAFYMATLGGGSFFGKVGSFEPGYEMDAVVLDDSRLAHPQELALRARLERCFYLADDREIAAKFVRGNRLF